MSLLTSIRIFLRSFWKAIILLEILLLGFSALAGLASFSLVSGIISFLFSIFGAFDDSSVKRKLIKQISNQVPDEAKSAISQLNSEGYLHPNWLFLRVGALRGGKFEKVNLSGADLRATDKNHHIRVTNLEKVNFTLANLSGANLTKANLKNAILDHTDLENANLTDAQLQKAWFSGTNLCGANLTNANLYGAIFVNVICDGKTVLPNGEKWKSGVNWAVWSVQDDTPVYMRKLFQHNSKNKIGDADLKILDKIWMCIKSDNFEYILDNIFKGSIQITIYDDHIERYQQLRAMPENQFRNQSLENAFKQFDIHLQEFMNLFSDAFSLDRSFYSASYKRNDYTDYGTERFNNLQNKYYQVQNKIPVLRAEYVDLIALVREIVPDNYNLPT